MNNVIMYEDCYIHVDIGEDVRQENVYREEGYAQIAGGSAHLVHVVSH